MYIRKTTWFVRTTGKTTETGTCYGMETNVEKTKLMRISRHLSPVQIMVDEKQQQNVEYFKYLGSMITFNAICKSEINPGLPWKKHLSIRRKLFSLSNWD
jgi:hypothetical protein